MFASKKQKALFNYEIGTVTYLKAKKENREKKKTFFFFLFEMLFTSRHTTMPPF